MNFARGAGQTFDQFAGNAPNTASHFAGWAALIVVMSIASGKGWGLRMVGGARDSRVDRTLGFAINLGMGLAAACATTAMVQSHYGVKVPEGDKYYRQIQIDPKVQAARDIPAPVRKDTYKAPQREAVNPEGSACTFKIDPRARKNCP